jgi:hypothetical protein
VVRVLFEQHVAILVPGHIFEAAKLRSETEHLKLGARLSTRALRSVRLLRELWRRYCNQYGNHESE